ncbi:secreted RxLR effector protein 161-like [Rutidosis leptorrhynchoides]|uniref:secreted RxLR effector protein 161-like n=1 Tax=Rutidosis leptorrhynchoides TaxID=125765 RepID=UPI003A9A2294
MSSSLKIDKDEEGKKIDQKLYRSIIGSLLYLTASRPDILFSVCICARFQSDPKESHLNVAKRIIKYVSSTSSIGLWYPKKGDFNLMGYSDADLAGCRVDRKSTSGTCQLLGSRIVSWFSRKQSTVSLSTTEAEYVALGSCCSQILWIKQQLRDFEIEDSCTEINCDNTSAINLTKNPILHSRAKHIEIRHHFIRDHVQNGDVSIQFVDSKNQLADIFTKPLEKNQFESIRSRLNILRYEDIKV